MKRRAAPTLGLTQSHSVQPDKAALVGGTSRASSCASDPVMDRDCCCSGVEGAVLHIPHPRLLQWELGAWYSVCKTSVAGLCFSGFSGASKSLLTTCAGFLQALSFLGMAD